MGINSHVKPGDMVATSRDNIELMRQKPMSVEAQVRAWANDPNRANWAKSFDDVVKTLPEHAQCLVIETITYGSADLGHVFKVMHEGQVGWLYNYDVYPLFTGEELDVG